MASDNLVAAIRFVLSGGVYIPADLLDDATRGAQMLGLPERGRDMLGQPSSSRIQLTERQEQVFRRLVRLAIDADKPIIVHSRKAEKRMAEVLAEEGAVRVNWHCFGGKVKLGLRVGEGGHWLSIPANVAKSESFRLLLSNLPRDKVLLETDCPYLSPDREKLNEPSNVKGTVAFAAGAWGVPEEQVVVQLEDNFERLFGFRP